MRVVVSGGTGFLGRSVVSLLVRDGHDVLVVAKDALTAVPGEGVAYVVADLNSTELYVDELARFNPQSCVHLAWQGIPDFSLDVCSANIAAASSFLDVVAENSACSRYVGAGTCLEYGVTRGACRVSAESKITSHFTWAKDCVHRFLSFTAERAGGVGLWLRVFYAYGPGQRSDSLVPSLVETFRRGVVLKLARPDDANDFVYVDDVAEAFARAATSDAPGGSYNVGSGESTRIADVARAVRRAVERASGDEPRPLGRKMGAVDFWADITEARTRLGWRPRVSLEDGIDRYVSWREAL